MLCFLPNEDKARKNVIPSTYELQVLSLLFFFQKIVKDDDDDDDFTASKIIFYLIISYKLYKI